MLNKKICRRCYKDHNRTWNGISPFTGKSFKKEWTLGRIWCPIYSTRFNITLSTETKDIIFDCPYLLEQTVNTEILDKKPTA
jgi:hypothetical protein